MSKKNIALSLLAVSIAAAFSTAVQAEENWMVRARVVQIDTANKSDPVGGTGASDRIHVSDKTIPEVDITYFWTKNIATELILTYPQKHDVTLDGSKIGTFKHLPPTLSLQYHFLPDSTVRPYVGAGVNYTRISSVSLGGLRLENDSWGFSYGAGMDIKIAKNLYLNFDVKKVQIGSDVYDSSGSKISHVKIDPWLYGVGLGMKF
jgi:outer membrane protein